MMKTLAVVLAMAVIVAFGGTAAAATGAVPAGISYHDDTVSKLTRVLMYLLK